MLAADMPERETEMTQSRSPRHATLGENLGQSGGEIMSFKLPRIDDDGTEISLKEWHLAPPSSPRVSDPAVTSPRSGSMFKGASVRTRFTSLELPKDLSEELCKLPIPLENEDSTSVMTATPGMSILPNDNFEEVEQTLGHHHQQETLLGDNETLGDHHHLDDFLTSPKTPKNGLASPKTPKNGGIAFDINLDTENLLESSRSSSRVNPLRVSFIDEIPVAGDEEERTPSPLKVRNKSPTKLRGTNSGQGHHHPKSPKSPKSPRTSNSSPSFPPWESSTKVGPLPTPVPKKPAVQPTLHGMKGLKKAGVTAVIPRGHPVESRPGVLSSRSEIRSDSSLRSNSGSWPRIGRSASDAQFCDNDSASKLITDSFTGSPVHSSREDMTICQPGNTNFVPQSFGGHKIHNVEPAYDSDDGEDTRVGMLCGGGGGEPGDFAKLLSKLCLAKPSGPKSHPTSLMEPTHKMARSNSTPASATLNFTNSHHHRHSSNNNNNKNNNNSNSGSNATASYNFPLGRHASLKLLQECCSMGPTPVYNVQKPRKIRDHEPHRHFYKTISKSLDQKLRS